MKKLFLTGFVALGLLATSCSEDDKNVGPEDGLNGHLTLTLQSPSMGGTKTEAGSPGREAGYGNEVKITDVTVVLTDGNDDITSVIPATMESTNTTHKFSIAPGTHKVYALVNRGTITLPAVGSSIESAITAASLAEVTSGFKDGSFFMTNYRHSGQASAGVGVTIAAGEEKVAAITVDRVAAKVVDMTETPTISFEDDIKTYVDGVKVVGFAPLNINPQFKLLQTWGKENGTGITLTTDVLVTPVIGTNLAPVSLYKELVTNGDGTTAYKNISTAGQFVDSLYTTENRPTIEKNSAGVLTARRNNTTGVIYKVQATKGGSDCGTFYAYNGKIYTTLTDLGDKYGQDLTGKTTEELRGLGIYVYEDGIMYYTYFIKDPNTNYQLNGEDYFGVFRNSVYRLNIKTIKQLGDDVPEDNKKPEEIIDPDDAYLKVELAVNDWVLNEIDIDF